MSGPYRDCAGVNKKSPEAKQGWQGETLVITAGPDPWPSTQVLAISNHSSGKMGYALAEAAAHAGGLEVIFSIRANATAHARRRSIALT